VRNKQVNAIKQQLHHIPHEQNAKIMAMLKAECTRQHRNDTCIQMYLRIATSSGSTQHQRGHKQEFGK